MLILCFRANDVRYAIPARSVVEVLAPARLRAVALAPASVLGLLAFRGMLIPVVELRQLLAADLPGTPDAQTVRTRYSERIIVVEIVDASAESGFRLVALWAECVTDLVRADNLEPGLSLPTARYLGEHFVDVDEMPQLILPDAILPEELRALFLGAAAHSDAQRLTQQHDAGAFLGGASAADVDVR